MWASHNAPHAASRILLFVTCYLLFVTCYLLFVICYLLLVICYLLFVRNDRISTLDYIYILIFIYIFILLFNIFIFNIKYLVQVHGAYPARPGLGPAGAESVFLGNP